MARKGRPSKAGKRYPSGKRVHTPAYDKGADRIQALRDRFKEHYNTALGRAYAAGLLGDRAEDLYHGGKTFLRLYARFIGGSAYRCPLDQTPRGAGVIDFITERDQHDHDWLHNALAALDRTCLRPWLDQLISPEYINHDPRWLGRLLGGGKDPTDMQALKNAIAALEIVSPEERKQIILVA